MSCDRGRWGRSLLLQARPTTQGAPKKKKEKSDVATYLPFFEIFWDFQAPCTTAPRACLVSRMGLAGNRVPGRGIASHPSHTNHAPRRVGSSGSSHLGASTPLLNRPGAAWLASVGHRLRHFRSSLNCAFSLLSVVCVVCPYSPALSCVVRRGSCASAAPSFLAGAP
jgi:hypothetical protein